MTNRLRRYFAVRGGDWLALAFAVLAVAASFRGAPAEAYAFPRLLSILLLIFCAAAALSRAEAAASAPLDAATIKKIAPGIFVVVVYIASAETVGFYASAGIAFFALAFLYGRKPRRVWVVFAVSCAIMAALFGLFGLLLRAQTPRGFFF